MRRGQRQQRDTDESGFEHHGSPPHLTGPVARIVASAPKRRVALPKSAPRRKPHAKCRGLAGEYGDKSRRPDKQAAALGVRAADRPGADGHGLEHPRAARLRRQRARGSTGRRSRAVLALVLLRIAFDATRDRHCDRVRCDVGDPRARSRSLPAPLWATSLVIFVAAWIGQFIGHAVEAQAPVLLQGCPVPADRPALVAGRFVSTLRYFLLKEQIHARNGDSRTRWPGCSEAGRSPDPELRETDVLVEVHATSVNPVDTKVRQRSGGREFPDHPRLRRQAAWSSLRAAREDVAAWR